MSDTAHTEISLDEGVESLLGRTAVPDSSPVEEAETEGEQSAPEVESEEVTIVGDEAESGVPDEVEDDDLDEEEAESLYEVNVKGRKQEVSLQTLIDRYQLQQVLDEGFSDLNRQKEGVNQQLAELQQHVAETQRDRERYLQTIGDVERRLSEIQEPPAELRETDPLRYQEEQIAAMQAREQARQFAEERHREQAKQLAERKRTEMPLLLKAIPEWNDPKVAERERAELVGYINRTTPLNPEEWVTVDHDHRLILWANKARKYDEMMEKMEKSGEIVAKKVKKAAPSIKSHSKLKPKPKTDAQKANERFDAISKRARSGDPFANEVEGAIDLLMARRTQR